MSSLTQLEAVISAGVLNPQTVVVLYDSSVPLPVQGTLVHLLDDFGYVVATPQHPDRPIGMNHNLSERVMFYNSTNPYSTIDATYWNRILDHAMAYSGQRFIAHFLVVGSPQQLGSSDIGHVLYDLKHQIAASGGITLQMHRIEEEEPYHHAIRRYTKAIKTMVPGLVKTAMNGMPAKANMLSKANIVKGGISRVHTSARLSHSPVRDQLDEMARKMLDGSWSSRNAFDGREPLFITLSTNDDGGDTSK
jgi:hypothetical protein